MWCNKINWKSNISCHQFLQHCFFFSFFVFRAAPVGYGRSQARGRIGAAASSLCHSHSCGIWAMILNALSEAENPACILMDTSHVCCRWATTRTPALLFLHSIIYKTRNWTNFKKLILSTFCCVPDAKDHEMIPFLIQSKGWRTWKAVTIYSHAFCIRIL